MQPRHSANSEQQQQEVLMEHFGFTPQSFTRRAVDLGNEVIYQAMDSIEKVVKGKLGNSDQVEKVSRAKFAHDRG